MIPRRCPRVCVSFLFSRVSQDDSLRNAAAMPICRRQPALLSQHAAAKGVFRYESAQICVRAIEVAALRVGELTTQPLRVCTIFTTSPQQT